MATNTHPSIQKAFDPLEDPRQAHKVEHPLENILFIILSGILCGAEKFTEIVAFGQSQRAWLENYLVLTNGIPSDDTLNRTLGLLAADNFTACFMSWMRLLGVEHAGQIAIDGKLLRGSGSKQRLGKDALDMVSAFAVEQGLTLTQKIVDEKSNEITAIPHLLALLDLAGCVVTIDAIGCQTDIATDIIDAEADYTLALKRNQGNLYEDAEAMFEYLVDKQPEALDYCKTVDKDHGRLEVRECWTYDPHKYTEYFRTLPLWDGLQKIVVVQSERTMNDKTSTQLRYFISSLNEVAAVHLNYVRSHWAIENNAHWQLDVALREDAHQLKARTTAANLSVIRQLVRNLLAKDKTLKGSIRAKMLKCAWNTKDREAILNQLFASL